MKQLVSIVTVATALLLTACNGQNPANRESNPIKDYPALADNKPASLIPPAPPQEEKPTQALCGNVYDIGFDGGRGRLMKFDGGSNGKYLIDARWYPKNSGFKLVLENAPQGMSVKCAANCDLSSGPKTQWVVDWTPNSNLVNSGVSFDSIVTIRFETSDQRVLSRCGSDYSEDFNVQVNAHINRPVLAIVLPKETAVYGETKNFKITVSNADLQSTPELNISFNKDAATGEIDYMDAQEAVGCSDAKVNGEQWIFSCEWNTGKALGVQKFIDKDVTKPQRFDLVATSKGVSSVQVSAIMKVKFPAGITTQQPQVQNEKTKPTAKKAKGATS